MELLLELTILCVEKKPVENTGLHDPLYYAGATDITQFYLLFSLPFFFSTFFFFFLFVCVWILFFSPFYLIYHYYSYFLYEVCCFIVYGQQLVIRLASINRIIVVCVGLARLEFRIRLGSLELRKRRRK